MGTPFRTNAEHHSALVVLLSAYTKSYQIKATPDDELLNRNKHAIDKIPIPSK